jgi:hypothetical protein
VQTLNAAGFKFDTEWLAEKTGYEITDKPEPEPQQPGGDPSAPVFDPNKDLVTLRRQYFAAQKQQQQPVKNRFVTVRGRTIYLPDDDETDKLKEQNDTTSQRSKALGKCGAREGRDGGVTTHNIGRSAGDDEAPDREALARELAGQKAALEQQFKDGEAVKTFHSENEIGGGGEHIVEHDPDSDRAIKHTTGGFGFGQIGVGTAHR